MLNASIDTNLRSITPMVSMNGNPVDNKTDIVSVTQSSTNDNNTAPVNILDLLEVWTQNGNDIEGEARGDRSGVAVSLSADGNTLAIGAPGNNNRNGNDSGYVRVFRNDNGTWTQIGNDIEGEAEEDGSGSSVSLSTDGNTIAIGASGNDDNGDNSGHVRVYRNDDGTWTQIGSDIDGEASGDRSGFSISLSADGNMIAIGAVGNDSNDSIGGNGSNRGHVRVFRNDNGSWTQVGRDINGEVIFDFSGRSSLSADGNTLAIGASGNDRNGIDSGHTRVFRNDNGTWTQIGSDIDGKAAGDRSGSAISLSADGNILAIGARNNDDNGDSSGHVRVYRNDNGIWVQIGSDINGEAAMDSFGSSVSLSADGSTLAIGATRHDGNETDSGHVRIFRNDNGTWTQIGSDIEGEAINDNLGRSVSLSADGNTLAVGATNDFYSSNRGYARVYNLAVNVDEDTLLSLNSISVVAPNGDLVDTQLSVTNGILNVDLSSGTTISSGDNESSTLTLRGTDAQINAALATLTYQANPDFNGYDTLTIVSTNSNDISLADTDTALIFVAPINDAPTGTATATLGNGTEDMAYIINEADLLQGFSDVDGDPLSVENLATDNGSIADNNDGTYIFNPAPNLNGIVTFSYDIVDGNSGTIQAEQFLSLESINDAPINTLDLPIVWQQIGDNVDGEARGDRSGQSVSLSADGKTIAIGADRNNSKGHVRIFRNNNGSWVQLGSNIDGEAIDDRSGFSVSLSNDGNTVAIGAHQNDGNGNNSGQVRVFRYDNDAWDQLGSDIDGEAAGDLSGRSVSLSSDGNTVAIGAHLNDGNGSDELSGHVRVFRFNNNAWSQLGGDIDGEMRGDLSGRSVSLSNNGNAIAIGAILNDGNGAASGHVRVFRYDNDAWTPNR